MIMRTKESVFPPLRYSTTYPKIKNKSINALINIAVKFVRFKLSIINSFVRKFIQFYHRNLKLWLLQYSFDITKNQKMFCVKKRNLTNSNKYPIITYIYIYISNYYKL